MADRLNLFSNDQLNRSSLAAESWLATPKDVGMKVGILLGSIPPLDLTKLAKASLNRLAQSPAH